MKSLNATEIKSELYPKLGESSPLIATVKRWVLGFQKGRTGISDEQSNIRPSEVMYPETIKKIYKIVIAEIAKVLGISFERVHSILHDHFDMKIVYNR